jgi:hypothetical protein
MISRALKRKRAQPLGPAERTAQSGRPSPRTVTPKRTPAGQARCRIGVAEAMDVHHC